MEQRVERIGVDRAQRLLAGQQALFDGVDGEAHGGLRGTLGVPRLEHVEPPVLDRELDVLHVLVLGFERAHDLHQLRVGLGHHLGELRDVTRGAHAGDDVLALRVDEEVSARLGSAGDLVAAEGDPSRRLLALVAEHHLLDVDRGAPVVGDPVDPPIWNRALARPGVEHRPDRASQLLLRVLGEVIEALELLDQLLQRVDRQFGIGLHAGLALGLGDGALDALARHALDDVAEHLDQPPVRVPGEALVVRRPRQPRDRLVVQAEVQDRVEHAGHRFARAAAHRHEQRILVVAELLAGGLLQAAHGLGDLLVQTVGLVTGAHVLDARLGGDREPGRDAVGAQHAGHLGDVRPLAAEKIAHLLRALGEVIHPLVVRHRPTLPHRAARMPEAAPLIL